MTVDAMAQAMIDNMPEKTGKALEEWFVVLEAVSAERGLAKHGELLKYLKSEHGLTHGFANSITLLYREQKAGGPPPADDLLAQQYAGAKAGLRPIFDAVVKVVSGFGADVILEPKKAYVSIRRSKQFAIVQPSTRTRVDLGLQLKESAPSGGSGRIAGSAGAGGSNASERLKGGGAFGGMLSHCVRIHSPEDIDAEVIAWLKQAYDRA